MKALYKADAHSEEVIEITPDMETIQEHVHGYFGQYMLDEKTVALVNEEGRLLQLPYTATLNIGGYVVPIVGPLLILGYDGEAYCDVDVERAKQYISTQ